MLTSEVCPTGGNSQRSYASLSEQSFFYNFTVVFHSFRYPCNCDAGLASIDVFDDGYLTEKDRLPVTQLHFGDTGLIGDDKWGKHLLGPLRCMGDSELLFCFSLL